MKEPMFSEEQIDRMAMILFFVSIFVLVGSYCYYTIKEQNWLMFIGGMTLFTVTAIAVYRSFAYFFGNLDDDNND